MIDTDVRAGSLKIAPDDVRQVYLQALEHLDQVDWSQMPALRAEVETTLRAYAGHQQLWRVLLSQALAHWHAGAAARACTCALAALRLAEDTGENFGVGCVACQLASMALRQDDYRAVAVYLTRAQLALELAGKAPPGGALAAAAQLCAEIIHWREGYRRGQIARAAAEAAIAQAQHDLLGRLRQGSDFMRAAWAGQRPPGGDDFIDGFPTLPAAIAPALPVAATHPSLRARLARWWRQALHAPDPSTDASVPDALAGAFAPLEVDGNATMVESESPHQVPRDASFAGREPPLLTAAAHSVPPRVGVPQHSGLVVYCFGNFRVYLDDIPIERWDSARGRTILKYLVARRDTPVPKELLAGMFWSESEPELARRSLHQAIYCLRQTFKRLAPEMQIVQFVEEHYQINPEIAIWVDAEAFEQLIEQARALEAMGDVEQAMRRYTTAVDLYSGEFLAEERYEAWAEEPRCAHILM